MSYYIFFLIFWYFKYIIKFILYCIWFTPYPYEIFKQALKEGLATTLKQHTTLIECQHDTWQREPVAS